MAALEAVEAEAFAGDEDTEFTYEGHRFSVLPPRKWRSSAYAALHAGNFELWASKVLTDGTYESAWKELDPDLDQIQHLVKAWQAGAGEDLGKSKRSAPSSRSTRRR
jgi:hypothetical protein